MRHVAQDANEFEKNKHSHGSNDPIFNWVRLFFVGGPISLSGGGEAGGNWIRQGVVRSGRGSGGRRYFCRQRPMGDFRWSSRGS